jgi:2-C-methyl-D-erythritol 4-phosphate cytidylyltransferase
VAVIIPAGGKGSRIGGAVPKQFLRIGPDAILLRTLKAFQHHKSVQEIVVVIPSDEEARVRAGLRHRGLTKISTIVAGGATRQESVWNGLCSLTRQPDVVLVHDAVRPFITPAVIQQVIADADRFGAAVVGVRVKDTIKVEERKGFYARTLPRDSLWAVQTPQGFRYGLLLRAHRRARKDAFVGTDEASLIERLGRDVRIVPGEESNLKITTPFDLRLARFLSRTPGIGG